MVDLRTILKPRESELKVGLKDRIMTIGSCFSQVIGVFLRGNKFDVLVNPFGTVYNPHSIFKLLEATVGKDKPEVDGFLRNGEVHYHYDYHSDLSALSKNDLAKKINNRIAQAHEIMAKTEWLMITFGTVVTYQLIETGKLVANCHKVPQAQFEKKFETLENIATGFAKVYELLKKSNPGLKIILTVSPVRHTRESLTDNSYSKALLRVACEHLAKSYENVSYFPAYEAMMDDLRDYRYYGHDLIHPNEMAEEYIWQLFLNTYVSEADCEILSKWNKLKKALEHRPKYPETVEHKLFLKDTLNKLEQLGNHLDMKSEILQVKATLGK